MSCRCDLDESRSPDQKAQKKKLKVIAKQIFHYSKQKDRLSLSPPVIALELNYCQIFVMPFLLEHTLRRLSLSPLAQRRLAQAGC